jgi:NAD+ kinase
LRDDRFALERRMMLQAHIERGAETSSPWALASSVPPGEALHLALNDFYFRPALDEVSPTCVLELEIDGEVVDQYRGDGLILATPTGSTGYADGSRRTRSCIPGIEAIVVNPICPMSLSSRHGGGAASLPAHGVALGRNQPSGEALEGRRPCHQRWSPAIGPWCSAAPTPPCRWCLSRAPPITGTLTHKLHWAGSLTAAEPSHN